MIVFGLQKMCLSGFMIDALWQVYSKMIMILKELPFDVFTIPRYLIMIEAKFCHVDVLVRQLGSWFEQVASGALPLASHVLSMRVRSWYAYKPNSTVRTMLRRDHQDLSSESQQGSKQCELRSVIKNQILYTNCTA